MSAIIAESIIDQMRKRGVGKLTTTERVIAAVWLFDTGVRSSGFAGYFGSNLGDLAAYAPRALSAVGAKALSELAARANTIFGEAGPPRLARQRKAVLRRLPESAQEKLRELTLEFERCRELVPILVELYLIRRWFGDRSVDPEAPYDVDHDNFLETFPLVEPRD